MKLCTIAKNFDMMVKTDNLCLLHSTPRRRNEAVTYSAYVLEQRSEGWRIE